MSDRLVGRTGRVVVRVRGGDTPGEVVLTVSGVAETFLAYAPHEIGVGTDVLVIGSRGGRRVDVEPWQLGVPGRAFESDSDKR